MSSARRLPRAGQPSPGSMKYPSYVDERGRQHEPMERSRTYVPSPTPSDNEDNIPIPTLPPSKRRRIEPSVAVRRARGDSVEIRIPARTTPNARIEAESARSDKARGKRPVNPDQARPIFQRAEAPSRSATPVQQENPTRTEAEKQDALDIQCLVKSRPRNDSRNDSIRRQRYIVFSSRDLPEETRNVSNNKTEKHIDLYTKWAMMDPTERQGNYKNKFGSYLQAKLK